MMDFLKRLFGKKDNNRKKSETCCSDVMSPSATGSVSTRTTEIRQPKTLNNNTADLAQISRPNDVAVLRFHALDKVYHAQFGDGTVLESKIIAGNEIVTVQFVKHGLKQVSSSYLSPSEQSRSSLNNVAAEDITSNGLPKDSLLHEVEDRGNNENADTEPVSTIEALFKEDLENVEFSGEFASAYNLMENTNENIIITGKAGTGKSTLLKYFMVHTKKNAVTLAPTGVSAINIKGDTIHSFFRFPPKILDDSDIRVVYDDKFKNIDTLIIDEFSMVNANLFDAIDLQMRANGKDSSKPFGGAQIIMFGDFFQLPPVVTKDEVSMFFAKEYGSPWFFSSKAFKNPALIFKVIELQQNHRQGDNDFSRILDNIRFGQQTDEELQIINSRFGAKIDAEEYPIILVSMNRDADEINDFYLNNLPGDSIVLEGMVSGEFPAKRFPTQLKLQLKPGAQVMTLVNDPAHRFVNGTIARVVSITEDALEIEVKRRGNYYKYKVSKHPWRNYAYRYSPEDHRVQREEIGTFSQFPVRLAWAITVHKSQGLTFDAVTLDIGNKAFANGQAYVAVSRCRSLQGLRLNSKIKREDIKVDPYALEFYKRYVSNL